MNLFYRYEPVLAHFFVICKIFKNKCSVLSQNVSLFSATIAFSFVYMSRLFFFYGAYE